MRVKNYFLLILLIPAQMLFAEEFKITIDDNPIDAKVSSISSNKIPEDLMNDVQQQTSTDYHNPKWWKLTLAGLGMAPVQFFISVAIHESLHAAAFKSMGWEVEAIHPYPHREENFQFSFGDIHVKNKGDPNERAFAASVPMFFDALVLGTYSGLVQNNLLPKNRYAQLGIFMFAAGHWVDLGNHILARSKYTDTQRIETVLQDKQGFSQTESRLIVRGAQGAVFAASGYFLYKGLRKIFKDTTGDYQLKIPETKIQDIDINKSRPKNLYFEPYSDQTSSGIVFGGTF